MTSTSYYYHEKKIPTTISEYITIGTGFDLEKDEALTRKRPIAVEEMTVRDSQGRRRFHGAYTGGFSAGYFNTCGSEEGWVPATFRSSRSDKSKSTSMKPEDFMDEEDLAEYGIAPRKLVPKDGYVSKATTNRFATNQAVVSYHCVDSLSSLIDGDINSVFDENKLSQNDSIGVKLLKNIGWKEGRGVGELQCVAAPQKDSNEKLKIYGCALPPTLLANPPTTSSNEIMILPKDTHIKLPEIRTNLYGLGYVPIRGFSEIVTKNDEFKPTGNEKFGIRGQAFGTGVLNEIEDDDEYPSQYNDIYAEDCLENYNFSLESTTYKDEDTRIVSYGNIKFVPSSKKLVLPLYTHNLPKVPMNYVPKPSLGPEIVKDYHQKPSTSTKTHHTPQHVVDPLTKSMILGDLSASEFIERRQQATSILKPAENLVEKLGLNIRLKKFVKGENDSNQHPTIESSNNLPANKDEILHYMDKLDTAMDIKKSGGIVSRRTVSPWIPEKIICKRFNVPYVDIEKVNQLFNTKEQVHMYTKKTVSNQNETVDSDLQYLDSTSKKDSANIIDSKINHYKEYNNTITYSANSSINKVYDKYDYEEKLSNQQVDKADNTQSSPTDQTDNAISTIELVKRPSIDLFKAIFAEDSDQE